MDIPTIFLGLPAHLEAVVLVVVLLLLLRPFSNNVTGLNCKSTLVNVFLAYVHILSQSSQITNSVNDIITCMSYDRVVGITDSHCLPNQHTFSSGVYMTSYFMFLNILIIYR